MWIATSNQGGPGWRAERRGVETIVFYSVVGHPVHVWRGDGPAKAAGRPEADIISHDQQDIGSILGCRQWLRKIGDGISRRQADASCEGRFRARKDESRLLSWLTHGLRKGVNCAGLVGRPEP